MSKKTRVLRFSTALCAVAALTVACSSETPAPAGEGQLTDVTIAVVKVSGSAPVYAAEREGFFKDAGLNVTIKEVAGPAAIATVQNGEAQFASIGATVAVSAIAQRLPLQILRGSNATPSADAPEGSDPSVMMVMPDSGIKSVKDLNGKVVATQTLTSQNTVMARSAMDKLGADSSSVKFLDVPFPDQMSALRSGSVDAAATTEPFTTTMKSEGAVPLFEIGAGAFRDGGPVGVFVATQKYAADNPKALEAFNRAMDAAVEWTLKDEQRLRQALPGFLGLPENLASKMVLPVYTSEVDEQGMKELAEAMVRYKVIDEAPSMERLLPNKTK